MAKENKCTEGMNPLKEDRIREKARQVAVEVGNYIKAHPKASMKDLQASRDFCSITLQRVGKAGYTCLYEAPSGIMRIHPNSALVDRDVRFLADKIPSWWAIFGPSLSGKEISGYYDWLEPDGSLSKKYMAMSPVEIPFHGITLMSCATTYINEA